MKQRMGAFLRQVSYPLALCFLFALTARADTLTLPEGLTVIESEAFSLNSALDGVWLPEGLETIGADAFRGSGVKWIYIPDSVTAIADDAFEGAGEDGGLLVCASADSRAAAYVRAHASEGKLSLYPGAAGVSFTWKRDLAVGMEFDLDPVTVPSGVEIAFRSETACAVVDAGGHVRIVDEGPVGITFTDPAGSHPLVEGNVLPVFYRCAGENSDMDNILCEREIACVWRWEGAAPGSPAAPPQKEPGAVPAGWKDCLVINASGLGPWTASVVKGGSWLRLTRESGSETFIDPRTLYTADANPTLSERTGSILFTLGKYQYIYEVRQAPRVPVSSVRLSADFAVLSPGDSLTLTAAVLPETADDRTVIWSCGSERVAAVISGKVTALRTGVAVITAKTKDGGKTAACPVNVTSAPVGALPDDNRLCLVIPGYKLNADGSMHPELVGRLRVLLSAAERYPGAVIVCAGGATADSCPSATEAERMALWLRANGVDPNRIYLENQSRTTEENASFTFRLLAKKRLHVTHMLIITSDYHIPAATALFQAQAAQAGGGVMVLAGGAWSQDEPVTGSARDYFSADPLFSWSSR